MASVRHERTAVPSIRTVQQPQTPCSHPTCVPVAPSTWRRKSLSSMRGSACPEVLRPLSVRLTRACSLLLTRRIVASLLPPRWVQARATDPDPCARRHGCRHTPRPPRQAARLRVAGKRRHRLETSEPRGGLPFPQSRRVYFR